MSYEVWGEPDDGPELPDGWLDEDAAQELRDRITELEAVLSNGHVAWMRYAEAPNGSTVIRVCDSDTEGAFKVYRAARATAEPSEPKLDKRAQVSNTRFGVGVKWSTVIGAAQRYHDFMTTPEKESERIEKGNAFLDVLTACGTAEQSRDSVIEECAAVCDVITAPGEYSGQDIDCYQETADRCARKIRALKSQQDAAVESQLSGEE